MPKDKIDDDDDDDFAISISQRKKLPNKIISFLEIIGHATL